MNVLGIETSCDETAAAVVFNGTVVKSTIVASQIEKHAGYGGVVPELAAREHIRNICPVVETAFLESGLTAADMDAVAVTHRPGLVPALLVGLSYAQGLAAAGGLPLIGVNHFLGHVYSCFMAAPDLLDSPREFPVVALVVSGGHTSLILLAADGKTVMLGRTLDDAAGEAFDKAAKILDLGYPGGPVIDRLAKNGDPGAVRFPRGLMGESGKPVAAEDRFNFSFSGIKTSLLYHVRDRDLSKQELLDVIASYQESIVDVLVRKTVAAANEHDAGSILLCGGVACNSCLRDRFKEQTEASDRRLVIAPPKFCTDNAAMIAGLAYHYVEQGEIVDHAISANARLAEELEDVPFTPLAPSRQARKHRAEDDFPGDIDF
ncbi:MAG: tRNA (adenosine(37)-N6)-threonylcarbamoyltransferase complex transferase subunit TsaD [Candidatus Pacebacteria bacterium]|nr:tRNA (adenosine(37)-N6)-threonylcarbamoyltransferase complex transferase subunit TsaD [Candidatus Paceibacterota bacterium]